MTVTVDRAQETIDTVHDLLAQFDAEYADVLPAVSAQYFHANERLTDRQRDFVRAILTIGEQVNSIAAAHVDHLEDRDQVIEARDTAMQEVRTASARVREVSDSYRQQFALLKEYAEQQSISKQEFTERHNELVETCSQAYDERVMLYTISRSAAFRHHKNTYGTAFRQALQHVGVEFVNGAEAFYKIAENAEDMRAKAHVIAEQHESALSYYPTRWVQNVRFPLKVYMSAQMYHGAVHFEKEGTTIRPVMMSSDYTSTVHEWGHIMEIANPMLGRAERLFLMFERERTDFGSVRQYEREKYIAADSLVDEYSGVYYRGRRNRDDTVVGHTYEVLTTGAEAVFVGHYGGFTTDPEHRARRHADFLLGLYAVLGR